MCAYHCAQLSYTTHHRTVLIIFPPIPQTIIVAQMMSSGGEREHTELDGTVLGRVHTPALTQVGLHGPNIFPHFPVTGVATSRSLLASTKYPEYVPHHFHFRNLISSSQSNRSRNFVKKLPTTSKQGKSIVDIRLYPRCDRRLWETGESPWSIRLISYPSIKIPENPSTTRDKQTDRRTHRNIATLPTATGSKAEKQAKLECGPMPNVMAALPNIGGALCSTPQSLADAQYWSAVQQRYQDAKPVEINWRAPNYRMDLSR